MNIDPRLTRVFATVFSEETAATLTEGSSTETVDGWDSRTFIELVVAIEQAFDIELSALDAARMDSIRGIGQVLAEKGVALNP